jgi:phage nucleotide-binding protein
MDKKLLESLNNSRIDMNTRSPYFRTVIYGDFGTGKTTFATSDPSKRTLVIDSSEGFVVLRDKSNVDVMEYKGLSQLSAVAQAIEDKEEGFDYDVVVVDELSTIYQLDLETVVSARDSSKNSRDDVIPEQRDYMASQNRVMKAVNSLFRAPVSVILLAHERRNKDDATGIVMVESDFAPRLSKEINRTLHVLGRLSVDKQGNRVLTVHPVKGVQAKTRLKIDDNPTLGEILNYQGDK